MAEDAPHALQLTLLRTVIVAAWCGNWCGWKCSRPSSTWILRNTVRTPAPLSQNSGPSSGPRRLIHSSSRRATSVEHGTLAGGEPTSAGHVAALPDAIDELVARYTAGEETPALSREYGISKSGLGQLLLAEGVSLRDHAITLEDAETARRLYESGLVIKQVVAHINYSYGTIRAALHEHGATLRRSGRGRQLVWGE